MATAIFDQDVENLPEFIVVPEGYHRALFLFRFRKIPLGQLQFNVPESRKIDGTTLHEEIKAAFGWTLAEQELRAQLDWEEANLTHEPPPSATVAICTRDRTDDLQRCLDSLRALAERGQEILVIDNCPKTEDTRRLVEKFTGVRYILEKRPGLDCARNRALQEGTGEIVAFIDDDAVADPNWLTKLRHNFSNPLVACVTGLTMPLELETEAQEWFERHCPFGKGFQRKVYQCNAINPHLTGQIGAGVNMALRREVALQLGGFDEALDAGTATHSGGDHEMFSRILRSGYHIVYDPAALSWHRHRRTWAELHKALFGYGVGVYALLTRSILVDCEWPALKIAWGWFRYDQLPALIDSLFQRQSSKPLDLICAELRGCLAGPGAYLKSRRRLLHKGYL